MKRCLDDIGCIRSICIVASAYALNDAEHVIASLIHQDKTHITLTYYTWICVVSAPLSRQSCDLM